MWNKSLTDFDRGDEAGLSHYDAIAALLYLHRNVDMRHNPYPALAAHITSATHHVRPGARLTDEQRKLSQLWPARAKGGRR